MKTSNIIDKNESVSSQQKISLSLCIHYIRYIDGYVAIRITRISLFSIHFYGFINKKEEFQRFLPNYQLHLRIKDLRHKLKIVDSQWALKYLFHTKQQLIIHTFKNNYFHGYLFEFITLNQRIILLRLIWS